MSRSALQAKCPYHAVLDMQSVLIIQCIKVSLLIGALHICKGSLLFGAIHAKGPYHVELYIRSVFFYHIVLYMQIIRDSHHFAQPRVRLGIRGVFLCFDDHVVDGRL